MNGREHHAARVKLAGWHWDRSGFHLPSACGAEGAARHLPVDQIQGPDPLPDQQRPPSPARKALQPGSVQPSSWLACLPPRAPHRQHLPHHLCPHPYQSHPSIALDIYIGSMSAAATLVEGFVDGVLLPLLQGSLIPLTCRPASGTFPASTGGCLASQHLNNMASLASWSPWRQLPTPWHHSLRGGAAGLLAVSSRASLPAFPHQRDRRSADPGRCE